MPPRDDFVVDERVIFSLDPQTVYQYDLRTASSARRGKPRRVPPMLARSASCQGITDTSLNSPIRGGQALPADGSEPPTLRARLRPLLAQSMPNLMPSEPQMMRRRSSTVQALLDVAAAKEAGENPNEAAVRLANAPVQPTAALDEEDLKIAQLGLETGEDAVNYFTAATKDSHVKFVHLVPADTGMEFKPYTLDVVPSGVAVARGDYFTMSRSGLVHCVLRKGTNATECISMNEWVRHSTFFNLLRSISYFKYFIPFKMFRQWRSNVRQHLFAQQRRRLTGRLFLARTSFCQPVIELKKEIYELKKATFIVTPKPRVQSDPLEVFMEQQIVTRKDAMTMCEAAMKKIVEITSRACEAVQTLDKNKTESEDPRKRLDALMAAKLEGRNAKARSMNAAVEEKRARKRLAARAAEDRGLLSDFVRLADCMMVETVVAHVLYSFNGDLLADFMDAQHKVGLFEVMVGFDTTGTIFTPTLDDFFAMSQRIADEIIALVSRIPRVLDARGCAEHCSSAAFASKFDEVIRSLPLFDRFMNALHDKFRDDFGQAMHNSAAFDPIRPVYEESKAFDPEAYRAVIRSFTESRKEFEQVCVWQKELDKMRTRESIGTIEVTSRQLKQTLSPFIEAKQDLLKGIIRDEARVQCGEVLKTLTRRVKILEATPQNLKEYAGYVEQTAEYDEREMRRIKGPVDQMYTLLQMNDVKIPPDDLVALDEMHSYATQYSEQLMAAKVLKDHELMGHSEQLDKEIVTLNSNLAEFTSAVTSGNFIDISHFEDPELPTIKKELAVMRHRLEQFAALAHTYAGYKELFGFHADEFPQLKKATDQLKLVERLWASVADWHASHDTWILGDLTRLDAEEVDKKMQLFQANSFSLNRKITSPVTEKMMSVIEAFKPTMPLVMDLGNPTMLPRHWERLFKALGKSYDSSKSFNLDDFIKWGVADHAELVSEVSGTASGESQLERALLKMEGAWETLAFNTKEWRTSHILVGIDEIQQELDDQIVRTQAMRGSRFVKPFLKRTTAWESMLTELQDIIDNWLKVQAAWLYLEPIFSSDDIMKQIPTEGRLFKNVNQVWMESMAMTVAEPGILKVARRPNLRESLIDANSRLDRIQKGLNDYLETKRLAFPRFFFLSNDELLEILAETKDPTRVQPHLKKCFAEDHQLLTNRGFMFLNEVEAYRGDANLQFASYNDEKKMLVYDHPTNVIVNERAEIDVVEFGSEVERERFASNDDYELSASDKAHFTVSELLGDYTKGRKAEDPDFDRAVFYTKWTVAKRKLTQAELEQNSGSVEDIDYQDHGTALLRDEPILTAKIRKCALSKSGEGSVAGNERAKQSNHFSIVATLEHRMYCAVGDQINPSGKGETPGQVKDELVKGVEQDIYRLWEARNLTQHGGKEKVTKEKSTARMCACAEGGFFVRESSRGAAFIETLFQSMWLFTDEKRKAFLKIYGFWLGDGSLTFQEDGPPKGEPKYVTFEQHRKKDIAWLRELISICGVESEFQESLRIAGRCHKMTRIHIKDPRWIAFFFGEYAHKYKCSANYKLPREYKTDFETDEYVLDSKSESETREGVKRSVTIVHKLVQLGDAGKIPEASLQSMPLNTDEDRIVEGEFIRLGWKRMVDSDEIPSLELGDSELTSRLELQKGWINFARQKEVPVALKPMSKSGDLDSENLQRPMLLSSGQLQNPSTQSFQFSFIRQSESAKVRGKVSFVPTWENFAKRGRALASTASKSESEAESKLISLLSGSNPPTPVPSPLPSLSKPPKPDDDIKSAKWLAWWCFHLKKEFAWCVIRGCRFDSSEQASDNKIFTSSVRARDEWVRLMLHAGYAAHFKLARAKQTLTDVSSSTGEGKSLPNRQLPTAKDNMWEISYAAPVKVEEGQNQKNNVAAVPIVHLHDDVRRKKYSEGRTWCVAMPLGFVIVRRAKALNGNVTYASVPTIQGNCFDGIVNLEFTDRLDILSCYDGPAGKSECLEFAYGPCRHRLINPRDSGGNVEKWLVEVEAIMKKSLAHALDESLVNFFRTTRSEWLQNWQGQTILTMNQVTWVTAVETAISQGGDAMQTLCEKRREELLDVVKSVRGDIPKMLRKTLGSLVVMDVHNRDITSELAGSKITSVLDFDWQAHLRYYHETGGQSAQSGEPGSIACKMINAMILYAYEYIGNCGRLVITPLTDRCYRTLMGAIHLNLGGAPEGPAGTGKTETTKDLGKAIAIQCVVTNCFTEEHQLLTNKGFMFLKDVEAHKGDLDLKFASYLHSSKQLVYEHPKAVVVQDGNGEEELIEFGSQVERERWAPGADIYGRSPNGIARMSFEQKLKSDIDANMEVDPDFNSIQFAQRRFAQTHLPGNQFETIVENMAPALNSLGACMGLKPLDCAELSWKAGAVQHAQYSNRVSIVATKNHDMYCALGRENKKENGQRDQVYFLDKNKASRKVEAASLTGGKLGANHVLRMAACAEGGIKVREGSSTVAMIETLFKAMDIHTPVQRQAFLHMYGFWLGDGSLAFNNGKPYAVTYSQHKRVDIDFLEECIQTLGIESQYWKRYDNDNNVMNYLMTVIHIKDPRLIAFFFGEYEHKFQSSDKYENPTYDTCVKTMDFDSDQSVLSNGGASDFATTEAETKRSVAIIEKLTNGIFRIDDEGEYDSFGKPLYVSKPKSDTRDVMLEKAFEDCKWKRDDPWKHVSPDEAPYLEELEGEALQQTLELHGHCDLQPVKQPWTSLVDADEVECLKQLTQSDLESVLSSRGIVYKADPTPTSPSMSSMSMASPPNQEWAFTRSQPDRVADEQLPTTFQRYHGRGNRSVASGCQAAQEFLGDLVGSDKLAQLIRIVSHKPFKDIDWATAKGILDEQLSINRVPKPYDSNAQYALGTLFHGNTAASYKTRQSSVKQMKSVFGANYKWDAKNIWAFSESEARVPGKLLPLPRPESGLEPQHKPEPSPFKPKPKPDPEGVTSAKWVAWWAFSLSKEDAMSILRGWRMADGSEAGDENMIFMSSAQERDQCVRLALHAGYSARFDIRRLKDSIGGMFIGSNGSYEMPICRHDAWQMSYSMHREEGKADRINHAAAPIIYVNDDVKTKKYSGRTWCVTLPSGFVVVRRSKTKDGVVTCASTPTIQGNCSARNRRPFFSLRLSES